MKRILTPAAVLAVGVLTAVGPSAAQADRTAEKPPKHTLVMKDPDGAQISQGKASQASVNAAALYRTVIDVKRIGTKPRIRSILAKVRIGGIVTQAEEPDLSVQMVNLSLRTQDRSEWVWSSAELFTLNSEGEPVVATEVGEGCSTWRYNPERSRVVYDVHGRCLKGVRRINRTNISSDVWIDHDGDGLSDTVVYDSDRSLKVY